MVEFGWDKGGHPLKEVSFIDSQKIQILSGLWINSVEQLLAIAENESGRKGLLRLLMIDDADLDSILEKAKASLPPERLEALRKIVESEHPMGLRISPEGKKKLEELGHPFKKEKGGSGNG